MILASGNSRGGRDFIFAGITEDNVVRLKSGCPIHASLETFGTKIQADLVIAYGTTNEDIIREMRKSEPDFPSIVVDPRVEEESAIRGMYSKILICTVGLPRSGKSTWARSQGYPIVNPDSIRLAIHGQRFVASAEPLVWATANIMVRSLFLAGHNTVILDATNTTRKRRQEWNSKEWGTFFKVIDTPRDECERRANSEDDSEILPVIDRMSKHFEPVESPERRWP
jgi:predicted kinase